MALTQELTLSLTQDLSAVGSLGFERVVNGDFATDSDWTKGPGWSIGSGVASCDGTQGANSFIKQSIGQSAGEVFEVTFTLSNYVAGEVKPAVGGALGASGRTANGTYTEIIVAGGSTTDTGIRANAIFVGDIDNMSIREIL